MATSVRTSPYACFQRSISKLMQQSSPTRTRLVTMKLRKFAGSWAGWGSEEGFQVNAMSPVATVGTAQPRLNHAAAGTHWCRSIQSPMQVATAQTSKKNPNRSNRLRVLATRANCKRTRAATRRSKLCAPRGLRKKKHHQDRGAVEAVEQTPGRSRQDGLVEQGVVGLKSGRDKQNHQDGGEQKPEQSGNALCATERI